MPIKKAAIKYLRQSRKRFEKNKLLESNLIYLVKKANKAIESSKTAEARDLVEKAIKAIDKAAQKRFLKNNTAARKKSALAKKINKLGLQDKKIK